MKRLRDIKGRFIKGGLGFWKGKKRSNISGDKNWRYNGGVIKKCLQCQKIFKVDKYRTKSALFCSATCHGKYRFTGSANPRWKGGISSKKDTLKSTEQYKEWRKKVYERDWFSCRSCGYRSKKHNPSDIEAHHIIPIRENEKLIHEVSNGITLCVNCHRKTFGKENLFAKDFKKILNDYTPNIPKG